MKKPFLIMFLTIISFSLIQAKTTLPASKEKAFNKNAAECLVLMEKAAHELSISGVAVIIYIPGNTTESWVSQMKVVGKLATKDINFLGVAYAKAAEMAVTFKNSGNEARKEIIGETGWQGGVIKKVESGYLVAAFSGGSGEQDVEVSTAGAVWLANFF